MGLIHDRGRGGLVARHKTAGSAFSWAAYWAGHLFGQDDLNLWAKGRSGLVIPDSIGSNDVQILTSTLTSVGCNLTGQGGAPERLFDGNSYTLYFKIKEVVTVSTNQIFFKMGNNTASQRGFCLWYYISGSVIRTTFSDGTVQSDTTRATNADFDAAGWVEVFVEVDYPAKRLRCSMYKQSDGSQIGTSLNLDISAWVFNDNNNAAVLRMDNGNFAYADLKKFLGLKTLAQCRDSSYVADAQFYFPTIVDGTDVSGNAFHLIDTPNMSNAYYYSNISTYCLDYGYSLYRSTWKDYYYPATYGYEDIYVPHTPEGIAVARTLTDNYPTAYVKIGEFAGSLTRHNAADSKLTIPGDNWDKSDTNIFEDLVRTSNHHNAGNTNQWHISELDYLIFSQRCKEGYKGLNFFKFADNSLEAIDRKFLDEIIGYTTNKTGNDVEKILQYTGDRKALSGFIKLYCDASFENDICLFYTPFTGAASPQIYWGDGTKREMLYAVAQTKLYSGTSLYVIYVTKPQNIQTMLHGDGDGAGYYSIIPENNNIKEFGKCINLEGFTTRKNGSTVLTCGDIKHLSVSLKVLALREQAAYYGGALKQIITGGISKFINLTYLNIQGHNTIYGDVTPLTKIITFYVGGKCYVHGSCNDMLDIVMLEGNAGHTPGVDNNSVTADIELLLNLEIVCIGGGGVGGDVTGKISLKYLSGDGPFYGSLNGLTNLWYLGISGPLFTVTGDLSTLTGIEMTSSHGLSKPTRFINNTRLKYLSAYSPWSWSSVEINQLLADLWTNRDEVKDVQDASPLLRTIELTRGGNSPTGQGLTDLAALRAYRSPDNNPAYALWTILVNE